MCTLQIVHANWAIRSVLRAAYVLYCMYPFHEGFRLVSGR